ncbi:metallophosphoesterase family protein [Mahella australiensis]|uniref:Metallophosphoesterase n=1 Tax=Mahella australiensis (strain DSM 15567 / CIP 107919 / 50-1 BON) TaxID=697281 RepID=F4A1H7_MAHA5|nr:metallophosphoesterase [Mahella australiensis]AEE96011.1 metallophosphoesterase [Mahella australiensis 50-1 BON]
MRFLFLTDTHIRGTAPRGRLDDVYDTLKNKLNEVSDIVHEQRVDVVLHGGDFFDRPDISPSIVREFAAIFQKFDKPIYGVAGNHDIYGHNPATIGRTMVGLLDGVNIIRLIEPSNPVIFEDASMRIQLTGQPYTYDIDYKDRRKQYYTVSKPANVDFAVHMVHGMLLEKKIFEGAAYTLIDDIADTEADITLSGHFHTGFGIKRINDKYFINPGSLIRMTSSMAEMERWPAVLILDIDKAEGISVKIECLKSAKPAMEVLDRTYIEQEQMKKQKLATFFQEIGAAGEFKRLDLSAIVQQVANNEHIGDEVKEEALRRIAAAEQYAEM